MTKFSFLISIFNELFMLLDEKKIHLSVYISKEQSIFALVNFSSFSRSFNEIIKI